MRAPYSQGLPPNDEVLARVICLPYAGGSAAVYRPWQFLAPPHLQVCPVELPGRGTRSREKPLWHMKPLIEELTEAVVPLLERPCLIYGHSMGGLLAFELARSLRRRGGPKPGHLVVSASPAPSRRVLTSLHTAPDTELLDHLGRLGGTPPEVLRNQELMELVLPVLRADFAVLETYEYRREEPISVPITVLGGSQDTLVSSVQLAAWQQESTRCTVRALPGGHFFLHDLARQLLELIQAVWAPPGVTPGQD